MKLRQIVANNFDSMIEVFFASATMLNYAIHVAVPIDGINACNKRSVIGNICKHQMFSICKTIKQNYVISMHTQA